MQVVVVRSPGQRRQAHWSAAFADELARVLLERGAEVRQLHPAEGLAARAVTKVAANHRDLALELELTRCLRERPEAIVVHVGVGARGSPNVLWLADRLGSRAIACLHAAEFACLRGDLVHQDGQPCERFDDAERCRACCRTAWWQRLPRTDLLNRSDLLLASLLVAEVAFVPTAADVLQLTSLGVPATRVVEAMTPAAVAARL